MVNRSVLNMVKDRKYGKIALVILITVLVWVWADLALDEEYSVPGGARVSVAKTNPSLWVSFNGEPSVSIETVVLKGPAAKIADLKRKLKDDPDSFEFSLDPAQEAMTDPGKYPLNVLNFLKRSNQITQLGLAVKFCKPDKLTVDVVGLVERQLGVKCLREDQSIIKGAIVKPAQVNMFVPKDWAGNATVRLSAREIEHARLSAAEKIPYIKLPDGQIRDATTIVNITIPPQEHALTAETVENVTPGFIFSANLQGKYEIELTNLDAVASPIAIRATTEAKRAYENMRYQVVLEIDDKDAKSAGLLSRKLTYNFPPEYVQKGEIELNQPPVTARFKLIPLHPAEPAPTIAP